MGPHKLQIEILKFQFENKQTQSMESINDILFQFYLTPQYDSIKEKLETKEMEIKLI